MSSKLDYLKKYTKKKTLSSEIVITSKETTEKEEKILTIDQLSLQVQNGGPIYRVGFDVVSKEEWQNQKKKRRRNEKTVETAIPAFSNELDRPMSATKLRDDDPLFAMAEFDDSVVVPVREPRAAMVPNRFDIAAGSKWDGVIRGNGYEDQLLSTVRWIFLFLKNDVQGGFDYGLHSWHG